MVAVQRREHWKDAALAKSEILTDAWEVTKTWAGRAAEWILFLCMISNIIEILPGASLSGWFINTVLGVQAVTLDIAGFGLATMAEQAMQNGETAAARSARRTAYLLIGLMMVTVLCVSLGTLWPSVKIYTDLADRVLILVRVAMTVVYGHVVHSLRDRHSQRSVPVPVLEERLDHVAERLVAIQQAHDQQLQQVQQTLTDLAQRMPPSVDMQLLAEQVQQLLPDPVEYAQLVATGVAPLLQQSAEKEREMMLTLSALQAALQQHVVAQDAQQNEQQGHAEESTIVDIGDYRELSTDAQQPAQQIAPLRSTKGATKGATNAKQKAQRILKRYPGLAAPELAKRAGISRQYASKILAEGISA